MKNANKNVVSLQGYMRSRGLLELKDVEDIVKYEQRELRSLEQDMSNLFMRKHKLRNTENLRKLLSPINARLLESSNWLEDQVVETADKLKAARIEKLYKTVQKLIVRSETARKSLTDDMAGSRYYEQRWLPDPAKTISLVAGAPIAVMALLDKLASVKHQITVAAGIATVPVGLYLAFKNQADILLEATHRKASEIPAAVKSFAAASALTLSVGTMARHEINPHRSENLSGRNRIVAELKL